MAVAATALCHRVCVDGCNIAFELRIFARGAVNCEMRFENLIAKSSPALYGFPHRPEHELRIRCVEVLTQGLDEVHEIFFIA